MVCVLVGQGGITFCGYGGSGTAADHAVAAIVNRISDIRKRNGLEVVRVGDRDRAIHLPAGIGEARLRDRHRIRGRPARVEERLVHRLRNLPVVGARERGRGDLRDLEVQSRAHGHSLRRLASCPGGVRREHRLVGVVGAGTPHAFEVQRVIEVDRVGLRVAGRAQGHRVARVGLVIDHRDRAILYRDGSLAEVHARRARRRATGCRVAVPLVRPPVAVAVFVPGEGVDVALE